VNGTGEDVDLTARIVDVIFADDLVPGPFEQAGERIADHGATAMAHVHRAGRIGRNIFDIDHRTAAHGGTAIVPGKLADGAQFRRPCRRIDAQVDKARPGNLCRQHAGNLAQFTHQRIGQGARIGPGRLGQDHGSVGRQVTVRGVARRLNRDRGAVQPGGQGSCRFQRIQRGGDVAGKSSVESLGVGHENALGLGRTGRTTNAPLPPGRGRGKQ